MTQPTSAYQPLIRIRGARQNNLKNLNLDIPTGELVVVTGVSGSGKSSLVFDTLYAEGQRRYVETFSPYARQFLDRQDRPLVDSIEGIPPAIAIDQTNPVRTSRSTVGTMTELNDHLKLLFAKAAHLHCYQCAREIKRDTPHSILNAIQLIAKEHADPRLSITFPVPIPDNFDVTEIKSHLQVRGYTRWLTETAHQLDVIQDRFRVSSVDQARITDAVESALKAGQGLVHIHIHEEKKMGQDADVVSAAVGVVRKFSTSLHCPDCHITFKDPSPSLFSFNSPIGACDSCRGFGRTIGVDYNLVIPDHTKSLKAGAIKPWQTPSFKECQSDLENYAKKRGIPLDQPWQDLPEKVQHWVIHGEKEWVDWNTSWPGIWYGIARFFKWLETKSYKMHVRVLLSKYRAYTVCDTCQGARLKTEALCWRLGTSISAHTPVKRFLPAGVSFDSQQLEQLPGLNLYDLMLWPLQHVHQFMLGIDLAKRMDEATKMLLTEINARLSYLQQVGLGYLSLDRQSRTLSGGEVQRINLTTALGTCLTHTLFVLDEPSIGLHPRDMERVIGIMKRLRDAGNSLVVVEHDPQIIRACDRILDIGPGPGEQGGEIVFFDKAEKILQEPLCLTGRYLTGQLRADHHRPAHHPQKNTPTLTLQGARAHNLQNIDVSFPLGHLVCITGVSGSGKSTLIQDVLYAAFCQAKGKPIENQDGFVRLLGHESLDEAIMVDQTPIGRTTRSNPASYIGAFDLIRELFAKVALSVERQYTAGTFSFNSGNGRCPACSGNGFEHVEMQFLSDVYIRCADCDGRRYRNEILEVQINAHSIAEVLELTVSQALVFFADWPKIIAALRPLSAVGLSYLRLGQPVPTLSAGEAQRLKLAGHLATKTSVEPRQKKSSKKTTPVDNRTKKTKLFLFDEPTTGLHFDDIAKLLQAFEQLTAEGHSLIVIEHNLDVIRACDWVIELGPEAGAEGGQVIFAGLPMDLIHVTQSHTGQALKRYIEPLSKEYKDEKALLTSDKVAPPHCITIHHAREHNLKNIDVQIAHGEFTVITGVSGSGKSTLAFDILFAEGQRRYLESLNAYARQFVQAASRPDVDSITGIPPTVAIEQRTSRGGRKSTVATLTEIYHFLRLLYVKLGTQHCPDCDEPIRPQSEDSIVASLFSLHRNQRIGLLAPLVINRKGYYTDLAAWAAARGHTHLRVDGEFLPTAPWPRLARFTEHCIDLPVADIVVSAKNEKNLRLAIHQCLSHGKGVMQVMGQIDNLAQALKKKHTRIESLPTTTYSIHRACMTCQTSFSELDPRLFSFNSRHGWCSTCYGTGVKLSGYQWDNEREKTGTQEEALDSWLDTLEIEEPCPSCRGERLNRQALAVRFEDQSIAQFCAQPVSEVAQVFERIRLKGRGAQIARDLMAEIRTRLKFLQDVGLGYLTLNRAAPTLSGGEAQRIRLAAQLGSNLRGVCYILDEPSIGLHPRDNAILLNTLEKLQTKGNTLVVVEHDEDTIRRATHVIDLGPGAGRQGGHVIGAGTAEALMKNPQSLTGQFLARPLQHPLHPLQPVHAKSACIRVQGANLHNLKNLNVRIPLGRLTVLTGVSGSGKSTLARDVLKSNLARRISLAPGQKKNLHAPWIGCESIAGWESVARVLEVDQTPIGKTPRSCPATYVGFWDAIRRLYAELPEARMRGYSASRFSFNTLGGRCETCEGQGVRKIEMNFLPDVKIACESCHGARFNPQTQAILFKGQSAGDLLKMSVDDAVVFFQHHPAILHALTLLQAVGLGYLTLGQQSPTLSGGEAQRIKLVTELAKERSSLATDIGPRALNSRHTLYVLDEPTVGLHMADVEKLIHLLRRLVQAQHTVVVIEHNLDVMANADWLIDLGPEGGAAGGRIVAQGSPSDIVKAPTKSHTARILRAFSSSHKHFTAKDLGAKKVKKTTLTQ
jgi:excinuclease ABC subunit A